MTAPAPLKALILAAGRGERMRPLTDHTPKPLLPVGGRPMIEWHLQALADAGVRQVVINTAWLEDQFPATLGDGSRWGLQIHYSTEGRDHGGALETAGGMAKALPWLGDCFWLVSGDIHAPGFDFPPALAQRFAESDDDAWLWLVPNPDFHAAGDFALQGDRLSRPPAGQPRPWTYANLALVRRRLVAGLTPGQAAPLGPLLFASAAAGRLGGLPLEGVWHNVGTPAQLQALAPQAPATTQAAPPLPRAGTALLALVLAAWCTGSPGPAQAADAPPTPARFTYQGLPPVVAGMSVTQAEAALGQKLVATANAHARGCQYSQAESRPGLRYAVAGDAILRVETRDPRYRTVSGVQVGDTLAQAEKAYKGRLHRAPHPYFDKGHMLTVTSPDKHFALIMESNDQGRIVTLRSGRLPEVAWLEAC